MSHSPLAPQPSLFDRVMLALPVIGPLYRAISKDVNLIFWLLPILVLAVVLAMMAWGPAALVMLALAAVPCMFAFFVVVTWP